MTVAPAAGGPTAELRPASSSPGLVARAVVLAALERVMDPELPMLSLVDLGVLRAVRLAAGGQVQVDLTPTYSGCPALAMMAADVTAALAGCGVGDVVVRTVLLPAWSSDDITATGRRRLAEAGIAPPGPASPQVLQLGATRTRAHPACPQCSATDTEELSPFAATSCQALWRCRRCREPFPLFKAL